MAEHPTTEMRPADWDSLAFSIATGSCILMLGPDAFVDTSEAEPTPVFARLGRQLKTLVSTPESFADEDFRAIAEVVMGDDLLALQSMALRTLSGVQLEDRVLGQLAELPFKLVVNAAPGVQVEQIWQRSKPETQTAYYDFRSRRAQKPVPPHSREAPLVYNLYGALEDPSSLILAESDLIEALVAIVAGNPDLPPNLRSVLRSPQHTFLFLGFRLQLWHLRLLLHVLAPTDPKGQSYALQGLTVVDDATRQFYRQGHKLRFCDVPVEGFVDELAGQVRELEPVVSRLTAGDAVAEVRSRPSLDDGSDRDAVFICHASEDKPQAEAIRDALQAAGFETWYDRDDLRGGQDWDTRIERTIQQARYVIVLQSDNLTAKVEGYVNKEIRRALARQENMRTGVHFVIPVVLDDERNLLRDLEHLQSIRMWEPGAYDQLVSVLSEDRARMLVR